MCEAYTCVPILKNLPLQIESVAAYDDKLLIGTKEGYLLMCYLTPVGGANGIRYDVKSVCNKTFAKKPVVQLSAIPELNLLISLSDSAVNVHSLSLDTNCPPIVCPALARCKGCTLFCVNVQKQETLTGEVKITLMLCAAVKRKLELFYWKNNTFCEHPRDLCVPDTPRTMIWCGSESLLVGFKSEYTIIKLDGETKQLFPTGRQPEPLCVKLDENSFALGRDEMTIFVNGEGQPTHKYAVHWSEPPTCLVHDYPYLVGIQSFGVEIRTAEPRRLFQKIEFERPRHISVCKSGKLYVASHRYVWCLQRRPVDDQIPQLLKEKQFELALKLADLCEEEEEKKAVLKHYIQSLHAFDLFCKKKYEESMSVFIDLQTDPSHVIGLFPDLLPEDFRSGLSYPEKVPPIQESDLEMGLYALVDYLIKVRHTLQSDSQWKPTPSAIVPSNQKSPKVQSKKQLLQIVDTTLLKCYLMTNVALVASLLRLQDFNGHLEECERALKKHQKLSELIILYQQKGQHKKALDLLAREATKPESPLKGHERTVSYLKQLGKDHIDLVFEYSKPVLAKHPEDGLKIFVRHNRDVEPLPRQLVLEFLSRDAWQLVIPYLECVIDTWRDETPLFHNTLLHKYREEIESRKTADGQIPSGDDVKRLRCKLANFLRTSQHYTAEYFPMHLLSDGLYEEAAVVLGKLGKHEDALTIYVHLLQRYEEAERYCREEYSRNVQCNKDVFLLLLQLHLYPSKSSSRVLNLCPSSVSKVKEAPFEKRLDKALEILTKYADKLDPLQALAALPPEVPVLAVREFFCTVLDRRTKELHDTELFKSLLFAEHQQEQERAIQCRALKLVVTELNICGVCQKKIGRSAFARFPDGVVVHYSCKDAREIMS